MFSGVICKALVGEQPISSFKNTTIKNNDDIKF